MLDYTTLTAFTKTLSYAQFCGKMGPKANEYGLLLFNQAKPEAGHVLVTCFGFAFYYF
ncbi:MULTISPECIES: hypothetical protein [Paenibacillus]|uniref:Uncharacterized protein n=1 Tax=Paenibacillus amylolyticus TaxID=1451 RepID=A0AAP5H3R1_PAEAM|nr:MULTISPECIES: hypothetical protein [Paenibacillus]MDR6723376.1 hypothetical protein [Paenibacillus amylolyticus]